MTDIFDLLNSASGSPRWAFVFQGQAWVGLGKRAAIVSHGASRFEEASATLASRPQSEIWFGGFSFTPDRPSPPWEDFSAGLLMLAEEVHGPIPIAPPEPPRRWRIADAVDETTPEEWAQAVNEALSEIESGALEKVVLARRRRLRAKAPLDPIGAFKLLLARHPEAYVFLFEPEAGVAFVGATPELLVSVTGRRLNTTALAGSAPRGSSDAEDAFLGVKLLASPKNRREHAIVVEEIQTALRPLTVALAAPQTPNLRRLPGIQHLETPIRAALRPGTGILQATAALHPTPALGGRPRAAALRFIADHEPQKRGWYASPIGMVRPSGEGTMVVSIRSALLKGNQAWLYAGAGIVEGSAPEEEWEETALKFQAVEEALFDTDKTPDDTDCADFP